MKKLVSLILVLGIGVAPVAAQDKSGRMGDYQWSPKGGFLAFTMQEDHGFGSLFIWSLAEPAGDQAGCRARSL